VGSVIDLTLPVVIPQDAPNRSIVWSIPEDSVGKGTITGSVLTPTAKGTLKLTATIANGGVDGATYTKTFEIPISITAVTDITGVPETGMVLSPINLSGVIVEPADASYKTIVWSVAADSPAKGTITDNETLTPTSKGTLKLTATIANGGVDGATYTKTFDINAASNITADVTFQTTEIDTSAAVFDLTGWTGAGTAAQSWSIRAVEQPAVYFAVGKTAAQTITVGGAAAALVTQAPSGRTLDGSLASATLNVFGVEINSYDLIFEGAGRTFTLTVSEPGKQSLTVTVNLTINHLKTGVAVYRVWRSAGDQGVTWDMTSAQAEAWAKQGRLERVAGIMKWIPDASTSARGDWSPTQSGDSLMDAIVWVDKNAEDDAEYLIWVEKDETLPRMTLQFKNRNGVTLRLRGWEAERVVSFDPNLTSGNNHYLDLGSGSSPVSADTFNIKVNYGGGEHTAHTVLSLEKNITFTGAGLTMNSGAAGNCLIGSGPSNYGWVRLIMLEGSKVTGVTGTSESSYVINMTSARSGGGTTRAASASGIFMFSGSSITGNKNSNGTRGAVAISNWTVTADYGSASPFFVHKAGASIAGNHQSDDPSVSWNKVFGNAAGVIFAVEPHTEYVIPAQ
jgi:hypothetical protein